MILLINESINNESINNESINNESINNDPLEIHKICNIENNYVFLKNTILCIS